jgi:two-component system invasion response regulator UvrY
LKKHINILIVDDHQIIRLGLKILIENEIKDVVFNFTEAGDEKSAKELISSLGLDLIILDIEMPNSNSYELCKKILKNKPDQRILILSAYPEKIYAKRFYSIGVFGYLNKSSDDFTLTSCIKRILAGKKYYSQNFYDVLSSDLSSGSNSLKVQDLSSREIQVIEHLIKGLPLKEISTIMNLHLSTVATYKSRIYDKLKITNLIELNEVCKKLGIID